MICTFGNIVSIFGVGFAIGVIVTIIGLLVITKKSK
mgnify:CR=1 FL=1